MNHRVRGWLQRGLFRLERAGHDLLDIRSGDPLAERFGHFGDRSRIQAPVVALENPASVYVGDDVQVRSHVCIEALAPADRIVVRIGDGSIVGHHVRFVAVNGIELAEECGIGHGVSIVDTIHQWAAADPGRPPWQTPLELGPPLRIGRGAWIGNNSVLQGGIVVGERAIVAPNSVVNRDVPPETLVSGNPGRRVPFGNEP